MTGALMSTAALFVQNVENCFRIQDAYRNRNEKENRNRNENENENANRVELRKNGNENENENKNENIHEDQNGNENRRTEYSLKLNPVYRNVVKLTQTKKYILCRMWGMITDQSSPTVTWLETSQPAPWFR